MEAFTLESHRLKVLRFLMAEYGCEFMGENSLKFDGETSDKMVSF
jgi:hypothetical protein